MIFRSSVLRVFVRIRTLIQQTRCSTEPYPSGNRKEETEMKMEYEFFVPRIRKLIQEKSEKEDRICVTRVLKNNGLKKVGITILHKGDTTAPAIYLESFYESFCQGTPMEELAEEIVRCSEENRRKPDFDVNFYQNYETVRHRVICKLVNYRKNREMLSGMPHRRFHDLAVIYGYLLEDESFPDGVIFIREEHRRNWEVPEEELYQAAMENTPRLMPNELLDLRRLALGLGEDEPCPKPESASFPDPARIYVLTNRRKYLGASALLFPDVLKRIAKAFGETYYILPSSVHECMILPDTGALSAKALQEMVKEINETYVQPEDVLGASIYQYAGEGKIRILLEE